MTRTFVLLSLLIASTAAAQPPTPPVPTSYILQIFDPGVAQLNGLPRQSQPIAAGAFQCGITPKSAPVTTPVVVSSTTKVIWDDPTNPTTADCSIVDGAVLIALPVPTIVPPGGTPPPGGYFYSSTLVGVVQGIDPVTGQPGPLVGPRSGISNPFLPPQVVPNAPSGLKVTH